MKYWYRFGDNVRLCCQIYSETSPCTPPECPPVDERHHLIRARFLKFNIDNTFTDQLKVNKQDNYQRSALRACLVLLGCSYFIQCHFAHIYVDFKPMS